MYSFNAEQTRLVNRSNDVQHFLVQNEDIYTKIAPFADQVNLLMSNNKTLKELSSAKGKNGKGSTKDKNDLKADIVKEISSICSFTSDYALRTGNNELYNAVHFNPSYIAHLRDAEVFGFVNNIVSEVTPLLTDPVFATYPVTADDLNTLSTNASTFNDNLGKAAVQNAGSRIASKNINAVLKAVQGNINRLNSLISYFADDNPDFVKGYKEATIVNHTGVRNSGIKGTITNSTTDEPIEGVSIMLVGKKTSKGTTTASDGTYEIDKFRVGKCKLTVTAPNSESKTVEVTIHRGKITELNMSLSSQVIEFKTA